MTDRAKDAIRNAVLIAGPTASGKSGLAVEIARRIGGVVLNADSMQVYGVLDVLTARPTTQALAAAPHRLYGHVAPSSAYSTGVWLREVRRLAGDGAFVAQRPVFVGGTGLYFKGLTEGLSEMSAVPAEIRDAWRNRLRALGPEPLHAMLSQRDERAARAIRASDGQRIIRALEVIDASGGTFSELLAQRARPVVDLASATALIVEPERADLHARINERFDRMVAEGAMEEVRRLLDLGLDPAMPAMRAIGVRELAAHIRGDLSLGAALDLGKAASRQYAKRQSTWFRHQVSSQWRRYASAEPALQDFDRHA